MTENLYGLSSQYMHDMWENFMKINTVIFDIGGVLVGYNWDKYLMDMFNDR